MRPGWLDPLRPLARRNVEQDARSDDRGYLLGAVAGEAARGLHRAVHGDATVEGEGIGLVAQGVDVGAGVLAANDDPRGPRTRPRLIGAVLVLVVAV